MKKKLLNYVAIFLACAWGSTSQAQIIDGGDDLKVGAKVTIEGVEYTVGPNIVTNPSFDMVDGTSITGWTVGNYAQMTTSNFTWNETGGVNDGAYIKSAAHTGANGTSSVVQRWTIERDAKYFVSFWINGGTGENQYVPVMSLTSVVSTGGGQNEYGDGIGRTIIGKNGEDTSESSYGYANFNADGSWAQTKLYFDSDDFTYLQFNARWLNSAYGFDEFYIAKLYDANTSEAEILGFELLGLVAQIQEYQTSSASDYVGIMSELDDAVLDYGDPASTVEENLAQIDALKAALAKAEKGIEDAKRLELIVARCEGLLNAQTTYPGYDVFYNAYDAANAVVENPDTTADEFAVQIVVLNDAIAAYRFSQEATRENPADYTFLLQSPWFCAEANIPASNSLYDIAAAELSSSVTSSAGWVNGSTATGGDQRLNYTQNRTCWNAWNNGYSGYLDIHQDVTGLPNGYYSITCDAITQLNCLNDQSAYVTSSAETVYSPSMTIDGWNSDDVTAGIWEELNTAGTQLVLVSDGKLTIGMRATRDLESAMGQNGWFCVTNFKLYYHGEAGEGALEAAFALKVAECQAQCDMMIFKGDKAVYQEVIAANSSVVGEEAINAALALLLEAQSAATTSIYRQNEILNGSYGAIQDSIAAGVYDEVLTLVMQSAVDNASAVIYAEGQTSDVRDQIINGVRAYRYDYADAYNNAQAAIASYVSAASKEVVTVTINGKLDELKATLVEPARIAVIVAGINNALAVAASNELFENGGDDYTGAIINPTVDGSSNTEQVNGWTTSYVNGNTVSTTSQQYDGNTSGRYFDSWNSTAKALLYNTHQTITNIPNGTYTLKAMCRTSGAVGQEGTYLYTIADNDSVNGMNLALVKRELTNVTEATQKAYVAADGSDSLAYIADKFGSVWQVAAAATDYGVNGTGTLNMSIFECNGNSGRGWMYVTVQAEVKDHTLTIGFTNDSTFTAGRYDTEGVACMPFTGNWISVDNFSLTLNSLGDNANWSPTTQVSLPNIEVSKVKVMVVEGKVVCNVPFVLYNANGQRVNVNARQPKGFYVVKTESHTTKLMVN